MTLPTPRFQQLALGDAASLEHCFTAADVRAWERLAEGPAPRDTVPEPLIAGLFSCLLGERLPGHGTNYLKQHLEVHAAAAVDEPLTARVSVTRLRPGKALVNLDTECRGVDGRLICTGEALVLFRR